MLRTALEDPADDSVDVLDSELALRVVFLWLASDGRRVVVAVLVVAFFLWVCCKAVTDSSDSSLETTAWGKTLS